MEPESNGGRGLGRALDFDPTAALASIVRSPRARTHSPVPSPDPAARPVAAEPAEPVAASAVPVSAPLERTARIRAASRPPAPVDVQPPAHAASDAPGIDARGHMRLPPGRVPFEALPGPVAGAVSGAREEARLTVGIRGWRPAVDVPCPTCGQRVLFAASRAGGDVVLTAATECPAPGAPPAYATPLLVGSGALAVGPDLLCLTALEAHAPGGELAERALDEARAAAGVVTVRLPARGWALVRREGLLFVGYPSSQAGPGEGIRADDEILRLPGTAAARLCLMDHGLFLERCASAGIDPATLRAARVPVAAGSYGVLHRPGPAAVPGAVHAILAPAPSAPAPVDPVPGAGVADGQALALLRGLARRAGSPFGGLVHAFCQPGGDLVWSGGLLRYAPRPRDAAAPPPPRPAGARPPGEGVAPWPGIEPPRPGSAALAAASLRVRMGWDIPPLSSRRGAPIQSVPAGVHPHWLAAALLFARTAVDRTDLLAARPGQAPARSAAILRATLADLADMALAHPDAAGVVAAAEEWRSLPSGAWS